MTIRINLIPKINITSNTPRNRMIRKARMHWHAYISASESESDRIRFCEGAD